MGAFVDFQILGARKHFAARLERARERLLARVHANVVDQLVFGLEGAAVARAAGPEAGVRRAFGPADVLHRQVRHNLVHCVEDFAAFAAGAAGRSVVVVGGGAAVGHVVRVMWMMVVMVVVVAEGRRFRLDPLALHLLFDGRLLAHVAEEGAGAGRRVHRQVGKVVSVQRKVGLVRVRAVVGRCDGTGWRGHRRGRDCRNRIGKRWRLIIRIFCKFFGNFAELSRVSRHLATLRKIQIFFVFASSFASSFSD